MRGKAQQLLRARIHWQWKSVLVFNAECLPSIGVRSVVRITHVCYDHGQCHGSPVRCCLVYRIRRRSISGCGRTSEKVASYFRLCNHEQQWQISITSGTRSRRPLLTMTPSRRCGTPSGRSPYVISPSCWLKLILAFSVVWVSTRSCSPPPKILSPSFKNW